MQKRKILFLTDYCGVHTGFGKVCKELLTYIYKNYNDKYEIILAAGGLSYHNPDFSKWPWEVHGVIPNDQNIINQINSDPNRARLASYGDYAIEHIVDKYKPDIIFAAQDSWGNSFLMNKIFFNKIPIIFHITLDSLPILKEAIDVASKNKYYLTWSEFAAKEMREKHNLPNVKTQYPCINTDKFYKLSDSKRKELRKTHNIPENATIYGFVFRNQLRKLINKLIEGYSLFLKNNPECKNTYLYTHTNFSEGWNIPDLCKQYNVPIENILCTYFCKATKEYFVMPFKGQDLDNPKTGHKKTLITTNVQDGVTDEQLNEVYNLFDFYLHPATSGAAELPCIEAALTELLISTCDYSFGWDIINLNKGSIPMEYDLYTEIGTQFLKSNPRATSIAKIMKKMYFMLPKERQELGKLSKKWAVDNYSIKKNAEEILKLINSIPQHSWNFQPDSNTKPIKNPNAIIPEIPDNHLFIKTLYKEILMADVKDDDDGFKSWLVQLQRGVKREDIIRYFRSVAEKDNSEIEKSKQITSISLEDLLDKNHNKRLLLVIKESAGDCINVLSVLKSLKQQYGEKTDIYIATQPMYFEIFEGNEYIHKVIPYHESMENELILTGHGENKGLFNYYIHIAALAQRILSYISNDNIGLKLNE